MFYHINDDIMVFYHMHDDIMETIVTKCASFLWAADEIKELWADYENNASLEASLVKDFDKVFSNSFSPQKL